MRFISNIFVLTGILIGFPLLFYVAFNGLNVDRLPDISDVESGYVIEDDSGNTYDLDQYIVGVLPSEIDTNSEYEAIKAQAVIIRTSILQQMNGKKQIKSKELGEKYINEDKLREQMGENEYTKNIQILTKTVLETRGKVMQAEGAYIVPLYHEVSVGTTVSAKELYGKAITYLQAVDSSADVEAPDYMHVEEWEYEDALALLKQKKSDSKVTLEQLEKQISVTSKTTSGYVKTIKVGDTKFSGEDWKEIFGLRSTNFYIEDHDHKMRVISLGKGHGLGLSQYGANEMAKKGSDYKKILKYYYTGIKIATAYK